MRIGIFAPRRVGLMAISVFFLKYFIEKIAPSGWGQLNNPPRPPVLRDVKKQYLRLECIGGINCYNEHSVKCIRYK